MKDKLYRCCNTCKFKADKLINRYGCTRANVCFNGFNSYEPNDEIKILEPMICAMRGRNPENPSDRTAGTPTEQRLEMNISGCSNTLTTVQKDNLVFEPAIYQKPRGNNKGGLFMDNSPTVTSNSWQENNLLVEPSGIYTGVSEDFQGGPLKGLSRTLKANKHDAGMVKDDRIRKLTPLECWRLMDFDDEDFCKAKAAGVSDSQLYKQASNSIVVNVLVEIFRQMI